MGSFIVSAFVFNFFYKFWWWATALNCCSLTKQKGLGVVMKELAGLLVAMRVGIGMDKDRIVIQSIWPRLQGDVGLYRPATLTSRTSLISSALQIFPFFTFSFSLLVSKKINYFVTSSPVYIMQLARKKNNKKFGHHSTLIVASVVKLHALFFFFFFFESMRTLLLTGKLTQKRWYAQKTES